MRGKRIDRPVKSVSKKKCCQVCANGAVVGIRWLEVCDGKMGSDISGGGRCGEFVDRKLMTPDEIESAIHVRMPWNTLNTLRGT